MRTVLIVGAGFSGAVLARGLAEKGVFVDVIDERAHVAGNCFDYVGSNGIRIHKYGPHIFHTNNKDVVDWVSQFGSWTPYQHKVKAMLENGDLVTVPPNKKTIEKLGVDGVVDTLFRPYTKKMWGLELEQLDNSIINRVKARDDDNELYFPNDKFQMLPTDGYTALFESIFSHPNIKLGLNTSFSKQMEREYDHVFNSMPIDVYYDFQFGELPYRSIIFEHLEVDIPRVFKYPTINFTNDGPYTRVTEWKNYPMHGTNAYSSLLTFERPVCYKENNFERYYPVKDIDGNNVRRYQEYKSIRNDKVTFIGRCGSYVYVDMHQAINMSLQLLKKIT